MLKNKENNAKVLSVLALDAWPRDLKMLPWP